MSDGMYSDNVYSSGVYEECEYRAVCKKCGKMFKGKKAVSVEIEMSKHIKYCTLPTCYKILRVVLLPFGLVGFPVSLCVMFLGIFLLLTVGHFFLVISYPFALSMSLIGENKVLPFRTYFKTIDRWFDVKDSK